jgi:hypothetical protein
MQQITRQHYDLDLGLKRSETHDKEVKLGPDIDTGAPIIAVGVAIKGEHLFQGLLRSRNQ